MNSIRKSILLGLAVISMGGATFAAAQAADAHAGHAAKPGHAAAHSGHAGHAGHAAKDGKHANRAERFAMRSAKLHAQLKLTAAQEAAWTAFQAAATPAAAGQRLDRAAWAALPAPARMEKRIAMSKQRIAMMEPRLAALNAFYTVLTPEQRQVMDQQGKGGRRGGHHVHHGHHGHHGQQHKGAVQG